MLIAVVTTLRQNAMACSAALNATRNESPSRISSTPLHCWISSIINASCISCEAANAAGLSSLSSVLFSMSETTRHISQSRVKSITPAFSAMDTSLTVLSLLKVWTPSEAHTYRQALFELIKEVFHLADCKAQRLHSENVPHVSMHKALDAPVHERRCDDAG